MKYNAEGENDAGLSPSMLLHFPIAARFKFLLPVKRTLFRWSPSGKGSKFLAASAMKLIEFGRNKTDSVSLSLTH